MAYVWQRQRMRTKKTTKPVKLNETTRSVLALFVYALVAVSSCANADSNEKSDELRHLEFVAEYSSCIEAMGLPSEEIKGDVSMLSDHKKRLKKYQKKRKRRIEKMRGLLSKSNFAEALLAQELSADPASVLTKEERKVVREVIRVSNNLWKKELQLYGLLDGWGYNGKDIPSLSLWSCHVRAIKDSIPTHADMQLGTKDSLEIAVLTPIGKGAFVLNDLTATTREVSKENIEKYGSKVLSRLRLTVEQCEIGSNYRKQIESLRDDKYYVDATALLCQLAEEPDFELLWTKSQRFHEVGIQLYYKGVKKVGRNSEYGVLYKEIQDLIYAGSWSKMVDDDLLRQEAVANIKYTLIRKLIESCDSLPCDQRYPILLSAIKELAVAEERKKTKFYFPIKRPPPPDSA